MVRYHVLKHQRSGFTLVEILVVVGIILLLMTLSVGALRSAIGTARQHQTEATILKVHGLMQQRMDAFYRALERTNLQRYKDAKAVEWGGYGMYPPPSVLEVMSRKSIFQSRFPQAFYEFPGGMTNLTRQTGITYVAANHNPVTESAALLYWILTSSEVYGIAPVDESEFSSNEVRDTDGDGLMEFVDGWGRPLRYYRCPTHLFRCGEDLNDNGVLDAGEDLNNNSTLDPAGPSSPVVRLYASILWSGLPALPTSQYELDPLTRDPDDPSGLLWQFTTQNPPAGAMTAVQNLYCTPNTYHAFLIVSAGPDAQLGLLEPSFEAGTLSTTNPSQTTPQGRLAGLVRRGAIETHPITDNITNRKR